MSLLFFCPKLEGPKNPDLEHQPDRFPDICAILPHVRMVVLVYYLVLSLKVTGRTRQGF